MRPILIETRTHARQASAPNNAREHWHTTFQAKNCDAFGARMENGSIIISQEGKRYISVPMEQIRYFVWEMDDVEETGRDLRRHVEKKRGG